MIAIPRMKYISRIFLVLAFLGAAATTVWSVLALHLDILSGGLGLVLGITVGTAVLIGFFFDVGVGSEFDRVVNIGKMGEKFAFIFIGLGTLITGSIFWNADRIVKATEAR